MNQIQNAPGNGLEVLASVKKQIDMLADQCRNVVISDAQSLERAKSLAKQAKLIENYIEDKRKELTKPILDRKKAIDDLAKSLTKELTEAVKHIREQILFYEQEQERKRLEELRRLEEERRRKEEEIRKAEEERRRKEEELRRLEEERRRQEENLRKAKEEEERKRKEEELRRLEEERRRKEEELKRMQMEGNIEQIEHIEKLAEIETKAAELSEKSKNLREVWTFEVVDISLVPREYLVLDETAVRRAIQNGVREIPGLKIFKKAQLVIK